MIFSGRFRVLCSLLLLLVVVKATATSSKSLYKTLGVSPDATENDIRKAYRKAALKHHPDKGGDEATFKKISEAYDILSDADKRRQYDQFGDAGMGQSGAPPQYGQHGSFPFDMGQGSNPFFGGGSPGSYPKTDLGEILREMMQGRQQGGMEDLFGMFQQQQPQRPPFTKRQSFDRELPCTLEELASGATKKMKVSFGPRQSKVFRVDLKAGWKSGTRIKFAATHSFPAITFIVKEKPHPVFRRKGNDLIYRYKLDAKQEQMQLKIPLLDGSVWSRVMDSKSTIARKGSSLTIPDLGMPIKGGPARGNLIVEFI